LYNLHVVGLRAVRARAVKKMRQWPTAKKRCCSEHAPLSHKRIMDELRKALLSTTSMLAIEDQIHPLHKRSNASRKPLLAHIEPAIGARK